MSAPFLAPAQVDTPRLRLRLFRPEDHAAYAAMYADPEVMRFIGAGGALPADACWRSMAAALGHWQDGMEVGCWSSKFECAD